jgi:hypothetical protein
MKFFTTKHSLGTIGIFGTFISKMTKIIKMIMEDIKVPSTGPESQLKVTPPLS